MNTFKTKKAVLSHIISYHIISSGFAMALPPSVAQRRHENRAMPL